MASASRETEVESVREQKKLLECMRSLEDMKEVLSKLQDLRKAARPPDTSKGIRTSGVASSQAPGNLSTHLSSLKHKDRLNVIIKGGDVKHQAPSLNEIKAYITDELQQAEACLALPFVVCVLMFFCLAALLHLEPEVLHHVDKAYHWDVQENANFAFEGNTPFEEGRYGHKNIEDVNSFADFWSWLNLGIIPLYFPEVNNHGADSFGLHETRAVTRAFCTTWKDSLVEKGWPASSLSHVSAEANIHGSMLTAYPAGCPEVEEPEFTGDFYGPKGAKTATYLYYHSIVAGMRMRQEMTKTVDCVEPDLFGKVFGGKCLPILTGDYSTMPETRTALFSDKVLVQNANETDYAKTTYLLSHTSQKELLQQTRQMENDVWLNPRTSKVELMFTTYNPHLGVFTANFVTIFITRAGHMYKKLEPVSLWLRPYRYLYHWVFDALWMGSVAVIMFQEGGEIIMKMRHDGCCAGFKNYLSFGNFIDWMNVFYALSILALWLLHCRGLSEFRDILGKADPNMRGSFETDAMREDFFNKAVDMVYDSVVIRRVVSFYPFVIVSRFLKVFSYQPRLALVTSTLSQASTDIIHFGVVFFVVFAVYTVSGMMLFGQELENFAGLDRAANSVFQILLGDFDYEEMVNVGRLDTTIWFVSFMLLVVNIMLNMLLAIILDRYTEVKGGLGDKCETLWSQAHELYKRWLMEKKGAIMPLGKILGILEPNKKDQKEEIERMAKTDNDYYQTLGVSRDIGQKELKKAYRKLALRLHPDKCQEPGAVEAFKKAGEAWGVLKDQSKRRAYDRGGMAAVGSAGSGGARVEMSLGDLEAVDDEPITLSEFIELVEGINEDQAMQILKEAYEAAHKAEGASISETNKSVTKMKEDMEELEKKVRQTHDKVKEMWRSSKKAKDFQDQSARRCNVEYEDRHEEI